MDTVFHTGRQSSEKCWRLCSREASAQSNIGMRMYDISMSIYIYIYIYDAGRAMPCHFAGRFLCIAFRGMLFASACHACLHFPRSLHAWPLLLVQGKNHLTVKQWPTHCSCHRCSVEALHWPSPLLELNQALRKPPPCPQKQRRQIVGRRFCLACFPWSSFR